MRALVAALTTDNIDHCTINVGSGTEVSIKGLAEEILTQTHGSSNTLYSPVGSGGVSRLRADLSLARRVLGYQPEVVLREGLRRVLEEDPRYQ